MGSPRHARLGFERWINKKHGYVVTVLGTRSGGDIVRVDRNAVVIKPIGWSRRAFLQAFEPVLDSATSETDVYSRLVGVGVLDA